VSRTAAWIALTFVVALAITDAALAPAPTPKQPNFIDVFLASKAVVTAIRIAIIFTALFVVLSVVALIARRQWLARVGPVEVLGDVSGLTAEVHRLEKRLEGADQVIDDLKQELRMHISC
jgi:ABC-type protease/lipase transport system fused ATPase/permease subunit